MCAALLSHAPLASTSGRVGPELRCSSGRLCGTPLRPALRPSQRLQAASGPVVAALGLGRLGNKNASNKYRTRQDLERSYFKEWNETTVLSEKEGRRPMTALTLLAFLPGFIRFYLVPGPVRYIWFVVSCLLQEVGYRLRKQAVIAGAKMDLSTLQRRGSSTGYTLRRTALRRLHGKDSVLSPLSFALGGRLA